MHEGIIRKTCTSESSVVQKHWHWSTEILKKWCGQMSHPSSNSGQVGKCRCGIHQENGTSLNPLALLCCVGHFPGTVRVPLEGRVTANQYKVFLGDQLYPMMEYLYSIGRSLLQDDSIPIHRAHWMVWQGWKWCKSHAMAFICSITPVESQRLGESMPRWIEAVLAAT